MWPTSSNVDYIDHLLYHHDFFFLKIISTSMKFTCTYKYRVISNLFIIRSAFPLCLYGENAIYISCSFFQLIPLVCLRIVS